jgi:WD40 repeat protein
MGSPIAALRNALRNNRQRRPWLLLGIASLVMPMLATTAARTEETVAAAVEDPIAFEERPQSLPGEPDDIQAIDISADGRHFATGGGRQTTPGSITLWDAATRRPLATWHASHGVKSVAFSPRGDRLASVGWDRSLVVRRIPEGNEVFSVPIGPFAARLAWSPDGRLLATAAEAVRTADGTFPASSVKLWDADTGKEWATLEGEIVRYSDVAFSPDGKLLAAAGGVGVNGEAPLGRIHVWDVESRGQTAVWKNDAYIFGVSFSPDGALLATGSSRRVAKLWDAKTGEVKASFAGHASGVGRPNFSPDGRMVATPGHDKVVKLWSVPEGRELAALQGHEGAVRVVQFSADGKVLATGGTDRTRWWDVASRGSIDPGDALSQSVLAIALSPNGRLLAVAHDDRTVRLLDAEHGQTLRRIEGFDDVVASLAFSPDGEQLVTGSFDNSVRIWDVENGTQARRFDGHDNWVYAVAFSPDGKLVASGGYDKTVQLWDAATGKSVKELKAHTAAVRSLAFSPDGAQLASGGTDRTVIVWSLPEGRPQTTIDGHEGAIRAVTFSPDGATLATAAEDKTVRLWDPDSGVERRRFEGHEEMAWCVAYSPRGRTLVSGGLDGVVKVWDPATGAERATLRGHQDAVTGLLFVPASGSLISASYDKTIKVWMPKASPVASRTRTNGE